MSFKSQKTYKIITFKNLKGDIYSNIIEQPKIINFTFPSHVGHGQYLVYSSKSSLSEECIIVFQVLVYKSMLSFFEECFFVVFQAPAQFPKNRDRSNTTLH